MTVISLEIMPYQHQSLSNIVNKIILFYFSFKREMYSQYNEDVDMVKAEKDFAELDKDKNGLISLEEFLSADEMLKKMKA